MKIFTNAGFKVWNTPTNSKKLRELLLRQPLNTTVIFFDYAGTTEGKYKGVRPALMFIKKIYNNALNGIAYAKTRAATDSAAIIIPETQLDRLIDEILKDKDEFGNLTHYGAYAAKSEQPSLSNLKRSIGSRAPDVQINPLSSKK